MTRWVKCPGTAFPVLAECGYCGKRGHTQDECRLKQRASAIIAARIAFQAMLRKPSMDGVTVVRKSSTRRPRPASGLPRDDEASPWRPKRTE